MATAVKIWTDEELMALPKDGHKRELLRGEIIMSPAGSEHGRISFLVAAAIDRHAGQHGLGVVFDSSTGFRLSPDDLLSPDAAFVVKARLAGMKRLPRGFFPRSPHSSQRGSRNSPQASKPREWRGQTGWNH